MQWYLQKSCRKFQKTAIPIITRSLRRRFYVTVKAVQTLTSEIPYFILKQLEKRVFRTIQKINNQFNFQPKQAPLIPTNDAFKIANHLWNDETRTRGTRESSIINRKKAATATVLAALSGSRWIDLHRLHWQDITLECQPNAKFLFITLRMTKNNTCNEVPQRLFWGETVTTPKNRSPIFWLQRYWKYRGKPKKGFIFGPDDSVTPDATWGSHTIAQVQRSAKILGFLEDKIPTRHSFRITMAITLYNLGVEKSRINRFMNWKTDRMQDHYVNTRDAKALSAPAFRLAALSTSDFNCLQQPFF